MLAHNFWRRGLSVVHTKVGCSILLHGSSRPFPNAPFQTILPVALSWKDMKALRDRLDQILIEEAVGHEPLLSIPEW